MSLISLPKKVCDSLSSNLLLLPRTSLRGSSFVACGASSLLPTLGGMGLPFPRRSFDLACLGKPFILFSIKFSLVARWRPLVRVLLSWNRQWSVAFTAIVVFGISVLFTS